VIENQIGEYDHVESIPSSRQSYDEWGGITSPYIPSHFHTMSDLERNVLLDIISDILKQGFIWIVRDNDF
jgi:hypothetical protein